MDDRIATLRRRIAAALDDAEQDGIELTIGLGLFRFVEYNGRCRACLIGACVGDAPMRTTEEPQLFEKRYGVRWDEWAQLEDGFELDIHHTPLQRLGASFRRRARHATKDLQVWCVAWRGATGYQQWCATYRGKRPSDEMLTERTRCGYTVVLPIGATRRTPTCRDCLAKSRGRR